MAIGKFFATLTLAACCMQTLADCTDKCETAYEDCKAAHDSPNGQKVCSSDLNECKIKCSEDDN